MTVRAITPAELLPDADLSKAVDLPLLMDTWNAGVAVLANLTPNERYQVWTLEDCRAFFAGSIAFMDTVNASWCALVPRPAVGKYEVIGGIKTTAVARWGACFKACAALLPPATIVFGRIPVNAPPQTATFLNACFPFTTVAGVTTWEATLAQVLAAI